MPPTASGSAQNAASLIRPMSEPARPSPAAARTSSTGPMNHRRSSGFGAWSCSLLAWTGHWSSEHGCSSPVQRGQVRSQRCPVRWRPMNRVATTSMPMATPAHTKCAVLPGVRPGALDVGDLLEQVRSAGEAEQRQRQHDDRRVAVGVERLGQPGDARPQRPEREQPRGQQGQPLHCGGRQEQPAERRTETDQDVLDAGPPPRRPGPGGSRPGRAWRTGTGGTTPGPGPRR